MDKFGVELDAERPKTASDTDGKPICPTCKAVLKPIELTGVPFCSNCGTKPFEPKLK